MPEYTIAVLIALSLVLILDLVIIQTQLARNKRWWIFIGIVILLQTIVDNYLNGRWWLPSYIVGPYPEQFYSGVNIIETPLENYGFGIALIWLTAIIFEYLEKSRTNQKA